MTYYEYLREFNSFLSLLVRHKCSKPWEVLFGPEFFSCVLIIPCIFFMYTRLDTYCRIYSSKLTGQ